MLHLYGIIMCVPPVMFCVGVVTSYSFDQLHAASTLGGYNASIKKSPPICHKYITTGAGPFLGFFYALEVHVGIE